MISLLTIKEPGAKSGSKTKTETPKAGKEQPQKKPEVVNSTPSQSEPASTTANKDNMTTNSEEQTQKSTSSTEKNSTPQTTHEEVTPSPSQDPSDNPLLAALQAKRRDLKPTEVIF